MNGGNLRAGIPAALPDELVSLLASGTGVRIERIVSRGHTSPPGFWYDQDQHELVLLVAGGARLELDGVGERALGAGDWLELPAHLRHRVVWTAPHEDTVWLAVFYAAEPGP
jgi:cupin 2 domain-containing protein